MYTESTVKYILLEQFFKSLSIITATCIQTVDMSDVSGRRTTVDIRDIFIRLSAVPMEIFVKIIMFLDIDTRKLLFTLSYHRQYQECIFLTRLRDDKLWERHFLPLPSYCKLARRALLTTWINISNIQDTTCESF